VVGTHNIQVYNNICTLQWQINSEVQSYVTKEMKHSLSLHILKAWYIWKDLGKEGTNSDRLDLMDDMAMTENVWSLKHWLDCKIHFIIFFQAVTVTNSVIWLVLSAVRVFLSLTTVTVTLAWVSGIKTKSFERGEKINKLFTGLGSVRIVKNCDLGLGHRSLYGPFSRQISYISLTMDTSRIRTASLVPGKTELLYM